MVKSTLKFNNTKSFPIGIVIGTGIALIISFLLSAALASLVLKGNLQEHIMGICLFVVRFVAGFVGGLASSSFTDRKILPAIGSTILAYLLILFGISIVAFEGRFNEVGSGILSALIGGGAACIIKLKPQRRRKTTGRIGR